MDALCVLAQQSAGGVQLLQRFAGLAEQPGIVESYRGVRRQGDQERDIIAVEGPLSSVGGIEHADHVGAQDQGHAKDGDQSLFGDGVVDRARVVEPFVLEVAGTGVGSCRLRYQTAEACTHRQAHTAEQR